jgi:hypothetical protein
MCVLRGARPNKPTPDSNRVSRNKPSATIGLYRPAVTVFWRVTGVSGWVFRSLQNNALQQLAVYLLQAENRWAGPAVYDVASFLAGLPLGIVMQRLVCLSDARSLNIATSAHQQWAVGVAWR